MITIPLAPFFIVAMDMVGWFAASLTFALFEFRYGLSWQQISMNRIDALFTGLIAATLAFFLLERLLQSHLTPLAFPRGRMHDVSGTWRINLAVRLFALFVAINLIPFLAILMSLYRITISQRNPSDSLQMLTTGLWIITPIAIAVGIGLVAMISLNLKRSLDSMVVVLKKIKTGRFTSNVTVTSNDEIGYVGDAINEMANGLIERDQMRQSLDLAGEVQQNLLPKDNLTVNGWAADPTFTSALDNRVTVWIGAEFYDADGEFSSTREDFPDIDFDLDDLDLNENGAIPIIGALVNFNRRWSMRLDYFGYHGDSKTKAEFNANFDDIIIPVGARIDTSLDIDVYILNFAYNFWRTQKSKFGLGVGAHIADIDLEISATVKAGNREKSIGEGHASILAPLPNLYATGAYAFTEKLIMRYGGGWMSLSAGDYDGALLFANAHIEYWPFKHAGVGTGYRFIRLDIEHDDGKKQEDYEIDVPGPVVYVTFGF